MCSMCMQVPCHPRCPNADEPEVAYRCIKCGDEIYVGDDYFDIDGEPWCEDCISNSKQTAET